MRLANEVELLGVDQDILNMTTQFKKIEVSPIYNVSLSTKYDFNNEDIRIIHWAGEKPWQNADVIFYSLWQEWEDTYNECFP
jgi:lipopolysaccharide biosynthesis glycosyltransferase